MNSKHEWGGSYCIPGMRGGVSSLWGTKITEFNVGGPPMIVCNNHEWGGVSWTKGAQSPSETRTAVFPFKNCFTINVPSKHFFHLNNGCC